MGFQFENDPATMMLFLFVQMVCLAVLVEGRLYDNRYPTERQCRTGANCGPNQCCVDLTALAGGAPSGRGECRPLGTLGSGCNVGSVSGQSPMRPVLGCPCISGLFCQPNGLISPEAGPQGNCVAQRKY